MDNTGPDAALKAPLFGAVGFAIGMVVASIIGTVMNDSLGCGIGNSIGFAVLGAAGGAALGLALGGARVVLPAVAGGVGFPLGHLVGSLVRSGVEEMVWQITGSYSDFVIGGVIETALMASVMLVITFAIGGVALGLALRDRCRILPLTLAGILGLVSGIAVLSMVGLRIEKLLVGIWPFALSGAAMGWVLGGRPIPRLAVGGATGLVIGFLVGACIGQVVGYDVRPDVIASVLGVALGLVLARLVATRADVRL